jgi:flagellin
MAMNAARNLSNSYSQLSTSVQRLSSGLRINSAADDAAGLAVRELMRSDITVLNQGVRNANDAISMIQTADGALSVIDEKLIRMKELAEQAATGTYTTAQRLIMDSEYQAMASEITRIATATDFNGVHLLDGSLSGLQTGHSQAGMKIHFGTGNNSAEDYYYIKINGATASALGLGGGAASAKANYVSSHNLVFAASGIFSNITSNPLINPNVPVSVQNQFDPNAPFDEYQDQTNTFHYALVNDRNGSAHALVLRNLGGGNYVYIRDEKLVAAGGNIQTQDDAPSRPWTPLTAPSSLRTPSGPPWGPCRTA